MSDQEIKLPLPKFLKILTNNGVPVTRAMAISGKIYKQYSTPSRLGELTDNKLVTIGLTDKEDRKSVLSAFHKAGYVHKGKEITKTEVVEKSIASSPAVGSSRLTRNFNTSQPSRKRKHSSDRNEFLSDQPHEDVKSFEFKEVLDESVLSKKSSVINRAPIMMAWSMIVAERLGFKRDEALSIASVYTEMNAITKGVLLGVFKEGKGEGMEATPKGSQPYVVIMGRSPLYQTQEGQWRALSKGTPVHPGTAFSYISRSFRQTMPFIIGALRLLALSYPPDLLNVKGWSLYTDFRPQADGWGKRSEVRCDAILSLRTHHASTALGNPSSSASQTAQPVISTEDGTLDELPLFDEPQAKKARTMTLEEYEECLDNDMALGNVKPDELGGSGHS